MPESDKSLPETRGRTAFFNADKDDRREGAQFILQAASGQHPQVTDPKTQEKWAQILHCISQLPVKAGEEVLRDFSAFLHSEVPRQSEA